jgi:hypothetical protein
LLLDGTLDDWKTKQISFQQRKRIPHHNQAFPVQKHTRYPHQVERL